MSLIHGSTCARRDVGTMAGKVFPLVRLQGMVPLGRPVGTAIYPSMQIASVSIWNIIKYSRRARNELE